MLWVVQLVFTSMNHNTRHNAIVCAGAPVPGSCAYLPYDGTSLPRRDGGLHGRLALLRCLFRLCFLGTVHCAGGTTPVLPPSTVPLIAEGTFRVVAIPRRTPSAPLSKPLLDSVASLLLACLLLYLRVTSDVRPYYPGHCCPLP